MFKTNSTDNQHNDNSVFESLIRILFAKALTKKSKYNRILPVGDYISDRWEKADCLGFGSGSSVYDSAYVYGDITVGKDVWIGPFTILDGSAEDLTIGSNTQISAGCQIYTHDSSNKHHIKKAPVHIGENVYLGPNVVIACGVTVGDNVIIGANSFVNSDIPSDTKAYGNPATY